MASVPGLFANHTSRSSASSILMEPYDLPPVSRGVAAAALLGQTAAFLALAVHATRRRDFD